MYSRSWPWKLDPHAISGSSPAGSSDTSRPADVDSEHRAGAACDAEVELRGAIRGAGPEGLTATRLPTGARAGCTAVSVTGLFSCEDGGAPSRAAAAAPPVLPLDLRSVLEASSYTFDHPVAGRSPALALAIECQLGLLCQVLAGWLEPARGPFPAALTLAPPAGSTHVAVDAALSYGGVDSGPGLRWALVESDGL